MSDKLKFTARARKFPETMWSIGIALSIFGRELYICINCFRYTVHIGWMNV